MRMILHAVLLPLLSLAIAPSMAHATPKPADPVEVVLNKLKAVQAEVVTNVVAALKEADADAGSVVNGAVKDPISHACYPAQIQYLQSLPTAFPTIATPAPYDLIVAFQYKRDFVNLILSGQLIPAYLKVGCSALLGNEIAILVATGGLIGIAPAAFGPLAGLVPALGAAAVVFPKF